MKRSAIGGFWGFVWAGLSSLVLLAGCAFEEFFEAAEPVDVELATPSLGVCTSVKNGQKLRFAGFVYVEESVRRFLAPQKPEATFLENLETLKQSALPVYSCNGFLPGSLRSTGPDADHQGVLEYAEIAFSRAARAGIEIIVFGSSGSRKIPEGFDPAVAREQFVALLRQMGPIAAEHGVTVAIEPLRRKECNFINRVFEATEIAREVNHTNIKVLADFYHMMQEDEGPESILLAGTDLVHCHIAENENRTPPGVAQDDFTPYLKALKEIGYQGRISVECGWKDFDNQIAPACRYLAQQLSASGY